MQSDLVLNLFINYLENFPQFHHGKVSYFINSILNCEKKRISLYDVYHNLTYVKKILKISLNRGNNSNNIKKSLREDSICGKIYYKMPYMYFIKAVNHLLLQVPIKIIPMGKPKRLSSLPPWWIKIVMACLWIILRDESQTVSNSPLHNSIPGLHASALFIPQFPSFFFLSCS